MTSRSEVPDMTVEEVRRLIVSNKKSRVADEPMSTLNRTILALEWLLDQTEHGRKPDRR